jgi:hypothetical protein
MKDKLMCQEVHESVYKCHMVRKLELENNSLVLYVRLGQTDSGFYHLVQGILKLHENVVQHNMALKLLKLDLMDSDEHFFHA